MLQRFLPAKADAETIKKRLEICRACPLKGELPIVHTEICTVCGCPIVNKTQFLNSKCPKGKW